MSSKSWQKELAIAQAAVLRAAKLTKKVLSSVKEVSKADSSPVTIADFAAQALLISILHAEFPNDNFVGEEDSAVLRRDTALRDKVFELYSAACDGASSVDEMLDLIDLGGKGTGGPTGRFWVMDPVDGTATFLTGEQYAVSLALVENGKEALATIVYPNVKLAQGRIVESSVDRDGLGVILCGVCGQGVTITWLPSAEQAVGHGTPLARLQTTEDLHIVDCDRNRASHRAVMNKVCEKLGVKFPGTDVWSSHVRYASLIIGGGDFLVRLPSGPKSWSCIWDHAGAQMMYRELGGKITDLDGKDVDFSAGRYLSRNRGLVLAKEDVHETVLRAVREVVGDKSWVE